MKKMLIFIAVLLYADVSDTLVKIKEIENLKKHFLNIDYNIFGTNKIIITPVVSLEKNLNLKIYAVFNNKININNKWYKIGDEINGYKILKITDDYVILKKENQIVKLKIGIDFLKVRK